MVMTLLDLYTTFLSYSLLHSSVSRPAEATRLFRATTTVAVGRHSETRSRVPSALLEQKAHSSPADLWPKGRNSNLRY